MRRAAAGLTALALLASTGAAAAAPSTAAAVSISASAEPAHPLFGDTFSYVVRVTTPAGGADAARIAEDVGPFTRLVPARVTRTVSNGVATITVTETLACLSARCLPAKPGGTVALPEARVRAGGASAAAAPVAVSVGSRVTPAEVQARNPAFHRPATLPAATTRVDPTVVAAALVVLGGALLAIGLVLILAPLRRRGELRSRAAVDPVARAARLLRESATRDATDRRRAAALAARMAGEQSLAADAAAVAWSRPEPAPPDATTLADRLEHAAGRPA
jgi:hypothetical protein